MGVLSYGPDIHKFIRQMIDYILFYAIATVTIYKDDLACDSPIEWLSPRKPWHKATSYKAHSRYEVTVPATPTLDENDWNNGSNSQDMSEMGYADHSFALTPRATMEFFWH